MHVYLAKWIWKTEEDEQYWSPPPGYVGSIDLRTLPQMEAYTGEESRGWGIFTFPIKMNIPQSVYLGENLDADLPDDILNAIRNILKLNILSRKPRRIIFEILTEKSDIDGLAAPKPLLPERKNDLVVHLGGFSEIIREKITSQHKRKIADLFRKDYERNYYLEKNNIEVLKKFTGSKLLQLYGKIDDDSFRELVEEKYHFIGYQQPETVIGDDFTDADGTDIESHTATGPNGGFGWTDIEGVTSTIEGNQFETTYDSPVGTRADSALSSEDQYSQVQFPGVGPSGTSRGALVRKDSSTTLTYYYADNRNGNTWRTFKRISGSYTNIGTNTNLTQVDGDIIKIEAEGSTIRRYRNGSLQNSTTDTAITGNLYAGCSPESGAPVDNFEAGDLGAAPAEPDTLPSLALLGVGM